MLLEQAFFHLPEILHGSGYQQQEYEAGIVGAFSMALLQTLNGRNIPNPIGCLQNEKRFRANGVYPGLVGARHLRADLYVNISQLHTATRRLGQYGWRHYNWLEAKFLRGQAGNADRHCTNKTNYVAGHLADLIRLAVLVPELGREWSSAGRYFLHAYDAPPRFYLTSRERAWCQSISQAGSHQFTLENLNDEVAGIRNLLGELPNLRIQYNVTNFVAQPSDHSHLPCYWCILTRVDGIRATLNEHSFSVAENRSAQMSTPDALNEIAAFVAGRIHIPPAEVVAPPEVDPPEYEAIDDPNAGAVVNPQDATEEVNAAPDPIHEVQGAP